MVSEVVDPFGKKDQEDYQSKKKEVAEIIRGAWH